ncbi:MAG: family 78 glycoside hydrolase catalytic domain [Candidatus Pedobacter colombiensis]|uniref:alpha-L-rhamnosidase n=1 Tax=Candidatus Pedobacter colombiensis TaxID=3121371 RepID=A0AAJ5WCY8_9SPHI|nr:family 78 glycoside hydrolase catalytic domain [Pedobacter sp.]WEK20412.1 MAG: family 78 glycoside hydrolase catalytic domain [Pedobacter sp.]
MMKQPLFLLMVLILSGIVALARQAVPVSLVWKAKWIEAGYTEDLVSRPAQYFKKDFVLAKKVVSAKVYVTSHGMYEAEINGSRVGDAYLTPGWTSYAKRLQYQVYDVARLLKEGGNTIQVTLGDGWYRGVIGYEQKNNFYGKTQALLFQMELGYADGTRELVLSDGSWKSAGGPIRYSELYKGEMIDGRMAVGPWFGVQEKDYGYSNLVPTENEPVRKQERFKPVKLLTTPKGEQVIDFGQNLVGWVRIKARGTAGLVISLEHAEVLDKAGNFYTDNLRSAKASATYVLSGKGEESFEPHFTFFGFRYVKVTGYPGPLRPEDFTAVALYSDMKPTGTFECSNPLLNQLQHNISWSQRGNFVDVPTDCPQRDERLGWTGDAQVFSATAAFNFDVSRFFSKWLKDVAVDQRADGAVTAVVPDILGGFGGATGWGDVATVVPWNMYMAYGDRKVLEEQYGSMKAWVGFMEKNSTGGLWAKGYHFGDWLSYRTTDDDPTDAITDKYLIAQCFFAHSAQLMINTAKVLVKTEDISRYEALLARIKAAFVKEYVTSSGRLMSNTQTAYVLALQFNLLPESMRASAAGYLVENIRKYNNHLTTGFLGTPYICHVLSRFGYKDVAYTLLLQESYPSWLYPVKMGATTIWERWDGIKPDGSFQNPGMNSFNHYAYGAIGDWMYKNIAGIAPLEPGYKKILIRPQMGGGLTWAKGSYLSRYGRITVFWKLESTRVLMDVEVPPSTTAVVEVPGVGSRDVGPGKYKFEGRVN